MFFLVDDADIVAPEIRHLFKINLQKECIKIKFDNDSEKISVDMRR